MNKNDFIVTLFLIACVITLVILIANALGITINNKQDGMANKSVVIVVDGKRSLQLTDSTRIVPFDKRFEPPYDVVFQYQILRNSTWIAIDSSKSERFSTKQFMIKFFEERHRLVLSGDTVKYFRLIE